MAVDKNNKAAYQEFRYIKIPDRRLISGLLHINVVNHNDNDAQNDFNQQSHEVNTSGTLSNQIKYSDTFTGTNSTPDFNGTQDRGMDNMKHSFADYDCFVFHVAGGMSLSGGINTPESGSTSYSGAAALLSAGFITGSDPYLWSDTSAQLTAADLSTTWYKHSDNSSNPLGDYCSHFVKYHLISRINNASGHGLDQEASGQVVYAKHRPIHRQTYGHATLGAVNNRLSTAVVSNEYVLSHGIYDTEDSQGTDLGASSYTTLGEGRESGTNSGFVKIETTGRTTGESQDSSGNITNNDGNTYFSPVDVIKIYGKHKLVFDRHSFGGNRIYSSGGANSVHITDFWDLVIDIGLRGNNPSAPGSFGSPNKSLIKPQINVMFQPFGETAEFDISTSEHTS